MTPRRLLEPARLAGVSLLRYQEDARLIDMVRDGQDRAFEAIVARHTGALLRHCQRLLPPGRAEDAVQQAFMSAYQAIKQSHEAEIDLRPWLHRIAHNACLSALRQSGWAHDELDADHDLGGPELPEQTAERRDDLRAVLSAVKSLPERQRDAIVLRELEGRSYEHIASELGVSDGAVRQLLFRARSSLRTAVTAVTPLELLYRLASAGSVSQPLATRVAEAAAGAGVGATVVKVGTAVLVTGAIASGAAGPTGPPYETDSSAQASEGPASDASPDGRRGAAHEKSRGAARGSGSSQRAGAAGEALEDRRRGVRRAAGRRPGDDERRGAKPPRGESGDEEETTAGPPPVNARSDEVSFSGDRPSGSDSDTQESSPESGSSGGWDDDSSDDGGEYEADEDEDEGDGEEETREEDGEDRSGSDSGSD